MASAVSPKPWKRYFPRPRSSCVSSHRVRQSLRFVTYKDRKQVACDLKKIYQAARVHEIFCVNGHR